MSYFSSDGVLDTRRDFKNLWMIPTKKYSIETTDYEVGQDNIQKWGFDIHNPVFGTSAVLIIVTLVSLLLVGPATALNSLNALKNGIINQFDSFFMWATNFFLLFALILIASPLGKIRIGGKEAKSEHSTLSWIAMLFAAGMGIGLLFWGVAEPVATLLIGTEPH